MPEYLQLLEEALEPRYELLEEVGRGGMATVYSAHDHQLGRSVAVKVLRPELSSSLAADRFKREISIAAKLSHRHVVPIYDSGESRGFMYYVMPLIEGETLREAMDRDGIFDVETTLKIARDVAEGLHYAHGEGVVHRDIKPQNILLTGGYAVIADFGVARALEAAATDTLTTEGVVLGTPKYMSPEQAQGTTNIDVKTDEYSLACVVHEMLTGHPPFEGTSFRTLLGRQLFGTIPSARDDRPDLPPGLAGVIQKALAKDPSERFDTVSEFVQALEGGITIDPPASKLAPRRLLQKPGALRVAVSLVAVAAAILLGGVFVEGGPVEFDGRPESAVVLPVASMGAEEEGLAIVIADELTRQLNRWESVHAIARVSLGGALFDLGVAAPIELVQDGMRVANAFGVEALVTVTVSIVSDTAFVDASLFDPRTGREVGQPMSSRGPTNDIAALTEPIALAILELDGQPLALEDLRRSSAHPDAIVQEAQGTRALESWDLTTAEAFFRQAVDTDSTYAIALHNLAQTLYWRAAQVPHELADLGPEIAELSASAVRHSPGLPARDSTHIRAFYSFQLGDYDDARTRYTSLIDSDSTDVYAWLMLGSVEFRDPWLIGDADGEMRPRANPNIGVNAFSRAVGLQPTFDLGYGHLFDVYQRVLRESTLPGCGGFEMPGNRLITPWEPQTPDQLRAFCLLAGDSLVWVARDSRDDQAPTFTGAPQLFDNTLGLLRRWAAYAPNSPKPHREIVRALVSELDRDVPQPLERADSLTRLALDHAQLALGLASDTTAFELVRLANMHLAVNQADTARVLIERVLADPDVDDTEAISAAANLFLAAGEPIRAAGALARRQVQRFFRDDDSGEMVSWGEGANIVQQLRVWGGSGVTGARISEDLAALGAVWTSPTYSAAQVSELRERATPRIAVALAFDDAARQQWNQDLTYDDPLWRALVLSSVDADSASTELDEAIGTDSPGWGTVSEAFLEGLVAHRLGRHREAIGLLARLDSIPPLLDTPDVGWALRPMSWFIRGEAAEALGDTASAIDWYTRMSLQWAAGDAATQLLRDELSQRLDRLDAR